MTRKANVLIIQRVVGVMHMQVCAEADTTDEEILEVCNRENPSGTANGWMKVLRDDSSFGPTTCKCPRDDTHNRKHYMVEW